ncbi:hypothetical protein [Streptomyces lydicus]|uniref:hypothetical protein n=1 Tax=Streptomyces lydicus TaxID=47763 RepID=UPI001F50C7CC|nr:hypothetical protein [Streptomyces lydicus]
MPEQRDALTELVKQHVGTGKRWSTREFAAVAVDPETGWAPGKSLVAKIVGGQNYTITPKLVSALAAGLELPREVIGAAAHLQTIGYTTEELTGDAPATLLRTIGPVAGSAEKARAVADRWEAEAAVSTDG